MENTYRNFFHIEPKKGLLNDPNGLIHFNNKYYFFHQWNRYEVNHCYKEWGLFTSADLVNWVNEGSAILPDGPEDKDGVYSGSAIENNGEMYLFYTGNVKDNGIRKSYQKMAISKDGRTFIKSNVSIETPIGFTENHRDPKVWKHGDKWWMIVGAQTKNNEGAINLFETDNLVNWNYVGIFYFDPILDQMCECPDVFSLSKDIDILSVCPQKREAPNNGDTAISSYSGYLVGKVDYLKNKFIPTRGIQKYDQGFDFYSPQTFKDKNNRRIIVAWMSKMNDEQEKTLPTIKDNYAHCLTMPRELVWDGNQLIQLPLNEYIKLRHSKKVYKEKDLLIKNESKAYEILIEFKHDVSKFQLTLNSGTNKIVLKNKILKITRMSWLTGKEEQKSINLDGLNKLQIFCDNSAIEIFINNGQSVFSMRTFCDKPERDFEYQNLNSEGSVTFYSLMGGER